MGKTLFQKIWDAHSVGILPDGRTQMFIATHLLHEVTSPQAFGMVRDLGLTVRHPERTFATVDHIIPTDNQAEPFADATADAMIKELRRNCAENGIRFFDLPTGLQGIVHMVGPELGITQPGMTIVCGDSHTATHGAFGSIAMGIGTTQVRDVLATQTMALSPLKVRRINVNGKLAPGVRAKDVALHIIGLLGAKGGLGFAYEYGGNVIDAMSMDERMTLCNMSIEGAARCGYVNPDQTTVEYIKGRLFAPTGADWDKAVERWLSFASDADAEYDEIVEIDGAAIEPTLTWGISPDQNTGISGSTPNPSSARNDDERKMINEALEYMKFPADMPLKGLPVQVCFVGSCTNGRISDFREVAALKGSAVAEVAAFKFDLRGPGGFFRADLKERVIRVGAPGDAVENEEFRFRTEESLITDPGGLQIRFGALCERARIAGIALAGVGFSDVAGQNQRVLFAERIHVSRVGVGHQDHVAGFNASPAGHRGAVKGLTVFEGFFRELMSGNGNVLFTAAGIGQAVIDKLNIVVFDHLQNVRGGRHILSPRIKGKCFTLSVAAGPEISSPASCCPK